jgi:hypothetical protein
MPVSWTSAASADTTDHASVTAIRLVLPLDAFQDVLCLMMVENQITRLAPASVTGVPALGYHNWDQQAYGEPPRDR